jgi:hypothetical protein
MSMTPLNAAPHQSQTSPPLSPDLRRQLRNSPNERARIRDVERQK